MKLLPCALVSLLLYCVFAPSTTRSADPVPERAPARNEAKAHEVINFSLLDYKGKHYELRRADAKVVVLYFTSFGCPSSHSSLAKLRALRSQFGTNGVVIWMVNSATQEDPSDDLIKMLIGSRRNALAPEPALDDPEALRLEVLKSVAGSLPVLRDERQIVARRLGVTHVGEGIAIDVLNSSVIYRGAINDAPAGAEKAKPKEKYLANALGEFLAGKPIAVGKRPVDGCDLKYIEQPAAQPISYTAEIAPLLQKH